LVEVVEVWHREVILLQVLLLLLLAEKRILRVLHEIVLVHHPICSHHRPSDTPTKLWASHLVAHLPELALTKLLLTEHVHLLGHPYALSPHLSQHLLVVFVPV
jgi:hypothetical protein